MEKPATFLKAMMMLMLPHETLTDFRAMYKALDDSDKLWFRTAFKTEYGWEWAEVAA